MSDMTFEEFLRHEEEREKHAREKRIAADQQREIDEKTKRESIDVEKLKKQKKVAQKELKDRIMREAHERHVANGKKTYPEDKFKPPASEVEWLVFHKTTGELLGEARTLRAYEAWSELNPKREFQDKFGTGVELIPFTACRCIQRADWEAAEARVRAAKGANGKSNGVHR